MWVLLVLAPLLVLASAEPPSNFLQIEPTDYQLPNNNNHQQTYNANSNSNSQQSNTQSPTSFYNSFNIHTTSTSSDPSYGTPIGSLPTTYGTPPKPQPQYQRPPSTNTTPSPFYHNHKQPDTQEQKQPQEQYGSPSPSPTYEAYRAPQSPSPTSVYRSYGAPSPSPVYEGPKPTYQTPVLQYQAEPTQSYGIPHQQQQNNYQQTESLSAYGPPQTKRIIKHVSVFIAPDAPSSNQKTRKYKLQGTNEKHVNIIFIKSPNPEKPAIAEVELPAGPEQKTLVYVLSKNQDDAPEIKIKQSPISNKPVSPDVYFIRYKSAEKERYGVPNPSTSYGGPTPSIQYGNSNPEPVVVNGPPTDDFGSYAPKMDHSSYSFIAKRDTGSKADSAPPVLVGGVPVVIGVNNLGAADFRPYVYAPEMAYDMYPVKSLKS